MASNGIKIAIVGGGLAGLAAAMRIAEADVLAAAAIVEEALGGWQPPPAVKR